MLLLEKIRMRNEVDFPKIYEIQCKTCLAIVRADDEAIARHVMHRECLCIKSNGNWMIGRVDKKSSTYTRRDKVQEGVIL